MPSYREVPIHRQRQEIYGESFRKESPNQRADDFRRKLIIDYSVRPEDRLPGYEKRDIWLEEAKDIIRLTKDRENPVVLDAGMSGGYLIRLLLENDFSGSIVGIDIEAPHLKEMSNSLANDFPQAKLDLGIADAEKLNKVKIGASEHQIPNGYFDVTVENFIHYHTHNPIAAINSAVRVTKPGGYVFFGGRAPGHLHNVYDAATKAAHSLGLEPPRAYYDEFDFDTMKEYLLELERQGNIRLIKEGVHVDYLWIDGNEQGWQDFSNAVMALLPDMNRGRRNKKSAAELRRFLDELLYPGYIEGAIRYYNGYILDFVAQKYFEAEVLK